MQKFLEFTKQYNDFVHQNLEWFQQRLFDIYVTCNPYSHKFVGAPKITTKFRPLCQIVTREAKINESRKDSGNNTISNIVIIQTGIVTYSHHCMTISCITKDGDRNDVHCPSPVTDFTRIAQDTVLATLPFKQMILIINSVSFIIKTLPLGFYKVSYVELSTFIGVEMFSKTIYLVDWVDNKIVSQFLAKEVPTDIAVGAGNKLLLSFPSISRVTCYNLAGLQLFEVETHYLNLVMQVTLYQNHFYVLQGHIIYRISTTGGVTMRDIGMKCRSVSVCRDAIFVTDDFGVPHMVTTNKDFWPRLSYNHQRCSPSLSNHFYIEDCYNITNILPMATSSTLIIYRNKKALVFTDTGEIISKNNLTFLEFPSVLCRINSNRFLVFYREMKGLQYITYPELTEGPLIKVHTNYITICHIVLNKFLALTTSGNKHEVHILLIKEDKVNVIERISLGHFNVTIAATPVNFVVVDGRENKLIFYLTSGEELFEKYLPFYGSSYFIYSDNIYFYVLFKRHSIVICYDIYGDIRWQWKLPFPVHPDIAVFQGTIYVLDTELNRVLLYKNHDRSSGCFLHLKNPYIRNLNIRLKEKGNVKLLIAEICHLSNGQLVVSDINHDCLLYISNEGDIVSRLSLPSTATDICRWNPNQIGVILPLEKQLRIIENLSETVRTVSLSQPYVRVCKLGKDKIACYSDKPSHLDILAIKNYNQVEIIHRINITFVVKSLAIENETQKLLIVTRGKAFQYNTSFGDGCHSSGDRLCSIKMVPRVLLSQVKCPPNFYAGSIDKTFVYLIDNSRMFAINDYNLMVNDLITNNQLNIYIDLVDVFSRNICVSEMLSSTLYLQDLTVSDKARHIPLSQSFGDEQPMRIHCLVITENNLIAGYDWQNKNIKIFTFDGQVLDSVKWNAFGFLKMCRWQSNTLVITDGDCIDNKYQLLTLKVEFPLSLVIYQTENRYDCITSLSNNQLVCSKWRDLYSVYVVEIDEIHSTLNEIKQIAIPETLSPRNELGNRNFITDIHDITVTAEDIIIVLNKRFIIFFNRDGQYLHSVRHYIKYVGHNDMMTVDDSLLYIQAAWDKCSSYFGYRSIVCLTQAGEYSGILLNKRIHRAKLSYPSINCKGPRFVGSYYPRNELYVQGLFIVNRESFSVARLQTDECPVEVKDFDISDEGKIVV
ncbi:uncharacterized protein LOC118768184 [Octopus sinensis]|uniref:Uncharacterized protein LOC118768184 n=1 Tax=Octopus sinensis TaxID=2607531 RepID=A0A7E6FQR0_9MOLL|nr:uncharacterized protein LOC118768184 [Octopus sinensis]